MDNENSFTPSAQSLSNVKLINSPFYEVIAEIIKPSTLVGYEIPSNLPGMRETKFEFTLSLEQSNLILSNRDKSNGKNEYVYQLQIGISLLQSGSTEKADNLPSKLCIGLNNRACPSSLTDPKIQPETKDSLTTRFIDCSDLVNPNPSITNLITLDWTPYEKAYVMGMYLIKKLTTEGLLQKLHNKEPRSSEQTKNDIIQKLADTDPDLAATAHFVSLLCPLGMIRMKIPVKSVNCDHLQCFDAGTYILMNEKKPTWLCPICHKPCLFDDIQIESYFLEIVSNPYLSINCNKVEILADGSWKACEQNKKL